MAQQVAGSMSSEGDWVLYVCDRTGVRQAVVDPYESAEIIARVNDVSTWTVTLPTDTEAGQRFVTDTFARLEVAHDGLAWRSGPMAHLERTVDADGDMVTVTGVDDTVWLQRRNAHPQPATAAPPYSTSAYDVHTGTVAVVLAELVRVNAGPSAVAARQVPGLTVPVPTPSGPSVTVSARWQNLLTLCQDTARPSGTIFDVVGLTFRAYPPANRGAVFSAGLETLAAWKMTADAATVNKAVVGGGGNLAARTIIEQTDATSLATWGLAETFIDRRDTTDTTELTKSATEALAAGIPPTTVVFTPLDSDGQQFGRDWGLGDLVTVVAAGLTVYDQIREIHVTLDDAGATIIPSVGAPAGDLALFRALAGLDRRVRQLERI
jgi:hypothetical protein